ncbi:MAG: glycosyltransferase [Candidatus Methanospirareceae archaeon]
MDDGSSDGTAEIAQAAGALVIPHGKNKGTGAAVRAALKYAAGNGFDALVLLDGDRATVLTRSCCWMVMGSMIRHRSRSSCGRSRRALRIL